MYFYNNIWFKTQYRFLFYPTDLLQAGFIEYGLPLRKNLHCDLFKQTYSMSASFKKNISSYSNTKLIFSNISCGKIPGNKDKPHILKY